MAVSSSTIISVTALVFSFGTTFVSYRRTKTQDIQAARQELRGILQRLNAIPRELLDTSKKYFSDDSTIASFSRMYNQENTLLVRQAAEIARRLPKNMVSATEYYEIALAQANAYNLVEAKEFVNLAIQTANSLNDELAALRVSAGLDFASGQPQAGRVIYQQALNIFAKYPGFDEFTKASTQANTEQFWGVSEAGLGDFSNGLQHLDAAQKYLDHLPFSPGRESLLTQIESQRKLFQQGNATQAPVPAPFAPGQQQRTAPPAAS
jgi:hypothetical protein